MLGEASMTETWFKTSVIEGRTLAAEQHCWINFQFLSQMGRCVGRGTRSPLCSARTIVVGSAFSQGGCPERI